MPLTLAYLLVKLTVLVCVCVCVLKGNNQCHWLAFLSYGTLFYMYYCCFWNHLCSSDKWHVALCPGSNTKTNTLSVHVVRLCIRMV